MAELLPENLRLLAQLEKKGSQVYEGIQCLAVGSVFPQVCTCTYIGVVALCQPQWVLDLLGYASLIAHAARRFKGKGWVQ